MRWGTNKDRTNPTYEITDAQTKKDCNCGTALEYITKTCLYNFDPLNPTFMLQKKDCGYSLEPPHRGSSNEYLQYMFQQKNEYQSLFI